MDPTLVEQVLSFWFEELGAKDWFKKSHATDAEIASRFLKVYEETAQTPLDALGESARALLAAIIVLDQFPRNLFRGNKRSFATDEKARQLAERAVAHGFDLDLTVDERVFLYLPFEHSERLADQERSVDLISTLEHAEYLKYALAHREVIRRFGRFPHRNAVLGRTSTPEELAYLAEPGSGF